MKKKAVSKKTVGGRPTKRSPEVVKRILEAIANGMPLKGAAVVAGITFQTLNDWRKSDPDLEAEIELARETARQKGLKEVREGTDRFGNRDWRAVAKWLELAFGSDYRVKPTTEVIQAVQVNNQFKISAEMLRDIQERKRRALGHHRPPAAPEEPVS